MANQLRPNSATVSNS